MYIYNKYINWKNWKEKKFTLPKSWNLYLRWNPTSDQDYSRYTQCPLSASAYVMYTVAPTIVLPPMSQHLWTSGPQRTMLQTSHRIAHTIGLGKSSPTVDKTLPPHRATLVGKTREKNLTGDSVAMNLKSNPPWACQTEPQLYLANVRYPRQTLRPSYSNTGLNAWNNGLLAGYCFQLYLYNIEAQSGIKQINPILIVTMIYNVHVI